MVELLLSMYKALDSVVSTTKKKKSITNCVIKRQPYMEAYQSNTSIGTFVGFDNLSSYYRSRYNQRQKERRCVLNSTTKSKAGGN